MIVAGGRHHLAAVMKADSGFVFVFSATSVGAATIVCISGRRKVRVEMEKCIWSLLKVVLLGIGDVKDEKKKCKRRG